MKQVHYVIFLVTLYAHFLCFVKGTQEYNFLFADWMHVLYASNYAKPGQNLCHLKEMGKKCCKFHF